MGDAHSKSSVIVVQYLVLIAVRISFCAGAVGQKTKKKKTFSAPKGE